MNNRIIRLVFVCALVMVLSLGAAGGCRREPAPSSAPPAAVSNQAPGVQEKMFTELREHMVHGQIEARGVTDAAVLAAMRKVPRHEFVPPELRAMAYTDEPLPIGLGQTISQPYIVAYMSAALELKPGDKVLEIGTGSGYQAAVLAELTDKVYSIEIVCELADRARATLDRLGYTKVVSKCGDGYQGWPEYAPFDAIIVTAAPEKIPAPLVAQLAPGGRMVIPVGAFFQELLRLRKAGEAVTTERLIPVRFVPMTGEVQEP